MEIKLTQGFKAIIDDEDYDIVSKHTWRICQGKYAITKYKGKTLLMHRLITNATTGEEIDHKNNNGLDNRKENLRRVNRSQNQFNRVKKEKSASKFKGVTRAGSNGWRARITVKRKIHNIGTFKSEFEAAAAYNKAAESLGVSEHFIPNALTGEELAIDKTSLKN